MLLKLAKKLNRWIEKIIPANNGVIQRVCDTCNGTGVLISDDSHQYIPSRYREFVPPNFFQPKRICPICNGAGYVDAEK